MAIPRETIDQVRNSVDIVEVIREYLPNIKKVGKDYRTLCPFHQDKKPSFYVSPNKNIFHCFGCHAGGDAFKFVMKYENMTYPEAVKKLAKRAGIEIEETYVEADSDRKLILEVLEQAADFYHRYLLKSNEAEPARKYLAQRVINEDTIREFRIGFAPGGNKFLEQAKKKYNIQLLLKTGLVSISDRTKSPYDHLYGRIVFPILNLHGNTIAFGGRVIPGGSVSQPVYLNTSETSVFSKSRSLYGLFQAKESLRESKKAVVFEGYMDVIVNHQEGIKNVVAPLGTSFTTEHVKILKRSADIIYFVFDSDESGQNAAIRAGDLSLGQDITCRIVLLPPETDPDEFVLKEGKDRFIKLIETGVNPVEFKLKYCLEKYDVRQPEGKRDLTKDMLETVKKIGDPIIRQEMIKFIASKLDLAEDIILSELRRSSRSRFSRMDEETSALDNMSVRVRSVEEEIIWLCLQYPHLCRSVSTEFFSDSRCSKVLPLLMQMNNEGVKFASFLDSLDEDTSNWLTQLSFEDRNYSAPEKILELLIKDLNNRRQEEKRRELEIEVISMLEGKLSFDPLKVKEFQRLTRLLKGSKLTPSNHSGSS